MMPAQGARERSSIKEVGWGWSAAGTCITRLVVKAEMHALGKVAAECDRDGGPVHVFAAKAASRAAAILRVEAAWMILSIIQIPMKLAHSTAAANA